MIVNNTTFIGCIYNQVIFLLPDSSVGRALHAKRSGAASSNLGRVVYFLALSLFISPKYCYLYRQYFFKFMILRG